MTYTEQDIVHEAGRFWVLREGSTYKVFETGITHSTRVALFAIGDEASRARAIQDCDRRAAADEQTRAIKPVVVQPRRRAAAANLDQLGLPLGDLFPLQTA